MTRIQWTMFIKLMVRSYLDNYVLPGTHTGSEILWLYMVQWKRHLANASFAILYLFFSQIDIAWLDRTVEPQTNNQRADDIDAL